MPASTDIFQQIAGNGPAPFNQFLRPNIPLDYGAQTFTPGSASGHEGTMTGVGNTVMSFLDSVGRERRASAAREDANTQVGIDNFQRHVAGMLANPDLTEQGREAIRNQADQIMNQHMHYAMKDVPKEGIHGFVKNMITQATGGPIKVREPINWDQATGQIYNAKRPEHSQLYNYQVLSAEGQQAIEQMKANMAKQGITPAQQDFEAALQPTYVKMMGLAPSYAANYKASAPMLGMEGSSVGYQVRTMMGRDDPTGRTRAAVPATTQPPALNYTPAAGYSAVPSPANNYRQVGQPSQPAALAAPVAAQQPAAPVAAQQPGLVVGQTVQTPDGRSIQVRRTGVDPNQNQE